MAVINAVVILMLFLFDHVDTCVLFVIFLHFMCHYNIIEGLGVILESFFPSFGEQSLLFVSFLLGLECV